MTKKLNREKQTAVLKKAQERRKQQKREQVFGAIKHLQNNGQSLTFSNIAQVAGCSVSYLYKWPEVTAYIHDLQNQKAGQLQEIEQKEPGPHSLKTLHEVSKQRIRELEAKNQELKRQNEKLRGHVSEIFELRDECERLRTQLRELTSPNPSLKVVPIQNKVEKASKIPSSDISETIVQSIQEMGIKLGVRLRREIEKHEPEKVLRSIEAFGQYRSQTPINNPGACLLSMIHDEAEPNIRQHPTTPEDDEFDRWYREAIRLGFCQDMPKNYLPIQSGKLMVRVVRDNQPGGYELMVWQDARALMENNR